MIYYSTMFQVFPQPLPTIFILSKFILVLRLFQFALPVPPTSCSQCAHRCRPFKSHIPKKHNLPDVLFIIWTLNTLDVFSEAGFGYIFTFSEIIELPSSRPAASRYPPDICIEMGSSPFPYSCKIKETSKKDVSFILVGEAGLEPARPQ